ncbi:hypothetical protein AMAG_16971 [Allomyces macrogynus ATCC 38327]|uniref:Proteasome assembly chaperone 1 n=1 Tax=Allomyces macrogynus (strain ATCC 38327) TaxID=578462 RepID=A0A0L0TDW5_ALLM3|nr:hypothetical protein AMAG_16971 [Allomyces macrogynus ATCC 38327]|eukprot:KNE72871.1 hypothetical protein AMAG_16971 [Allomyces macrogynus ATCC 38327]
MSLLEELGARGAPSRQLYDDDFDADAAPRTSTRSRASNGPPPTLQPPPRSASRALIVGAGVGGNLVQAVAETVGATKLGSWTVEFPRPYAAYRADDTPVTVALPVYHDAHRETALLPLHLVTATFPPELYTALYRSVLSVLDPSLVVAATHIDLITSLSTQSTIQVLANPHNTVAATKYARVAPPTVLSDVGAAFVTQATLDAKRAVAVAAVVPRVYGEPDVTPKMLEEWARAVWDLAGVSQGVEGVLEKAAKSAEGAVRRTASFNPMYM